MTDEEIAAEVISQLESLIHMPNFTHAQRGQAENIIYRAIGKAKFEMRNAWQQELKEERNPFTGEENETDPKIQSQNPASS